MQLVLRHTRHSCQACKQACTCSKRCADATAGTQSLGCRAVHAAWQRFTAVKRRQTSARAARAQALKLPWRSSMTLLKTSTSAGSSGLRAGALRPCSKPRLQPDRAWTHFRAPCAPRRPSLPQQQVHFTPDMHEPGQPDGHHRGLRGPRTSRPAHVAQIIRPGQQGQTARWAPQQGLRRRT